MYGCLGCALHKDATSKTVSVTLYASYYLKKTNLFCILISTLLTAKMNDLHIYDSNLPTDGNSLEEGVPFLVYTKMP